MSNGRAGAGGSRPAATPPSLHEMSEGTTSVAIWPGELRAARTASAASRPRLSVRDDTRTQSDAVSATFCVSMASGG